MGPEVWFIGGYLYTFMATELKSQYDTSSRISSSTESYCLTCPLALQSIQRWGQGGVYSLSTLVSTHRIEDNGIPLNGFP